METKEQLIQAIITYLNFDSVSDKRWHSPFSDERQAKVRKDAEKITEVLYLKYINKNGREKMEYRSLEKENGKR